MFESIEEIIGAEPAGNEGTKEGRIVICCTLEMEAEFERVKNLSKKRRKQVCEKMRKLADLLIQEYKKIDAITEKAG